MRNLQVRLTFLADTKTAKAQMASLQNSLSQLATQASTGTPLGITSSLQAASADAVKLKVALQQATNVDTGKLNLGKFNTELKKSGMTIQQYGASLARLGPQGVQAFNQVTTAIINAERATWQLSTITKKLGNTFLNTLKWQAASTTIMGVTRAISETVNYAEELNKSLTNIRIVTGKSTEEMSRFAKQANQAAKELSASTTEYSNASLIYYQQGLGDKEVKERTDATIKLAKVAGENAQTVSEWTTAIWNNFDDGSQSLEHYADVLVKLGAATASSSAEIANGLEKFAAIADTVGLSYEYAASALATITAQTRQSEDVVGTALKTIFSRMEGLSLGETLEDGTDLNKYSNTLLAAGVNIKDANGQIKEMDQILDETGATWKTLSKDQQIALAQGVAGIRQYNQFIAMMDNYDLMKQNIALAKSSTGALEEQFAIYEEGVEGAKNRLTATLEEVKNSILDENALVGWYDALSTLTKFLGSMVDSMGGLPGILTMIGALLVKVTAPRLMTALSTMVNNIKNISIFGKASQSKLISGAISTSAAIGARPDGGYGYTENAANNQILTEREAIQSNLTRLNDLLSAGQKEQINLHTQILEKYEEEYLAAARLSEITEQQAHTERQRIYAMAKNAPNQHDATNKVERFETIAEHVGKSAYSNSELISMGAQVSEADSMQNRSDNASAMLKQAQISRDSTITAIKNTPYSETFNPEQKKAAIAEVNQAYDNLATSVNNYKNGEIDSAKAVKASTKAFAGITGKNGIKSYSAGLTQASKALGKNKTEQAQAQRALQNFGKATIQNTKNLAKAEKANKRYQKTLQQVHKAMLNGVTASNALGKATTSMISGMASGAMAVNMMYNSVKQLSLAWRTGSKDAEDYIGSITSMLMSLPMYISMFSQIVAAISNVTLAFQLKKHAVDKDTLSTQLNSAADLEQIATTETETTVTQAHTAAVEGETVADSIETTGDEIDTAVDIAAMGVDNAATKQEIKNGNERIANAGTESIANIGVAVTKSLKWFSNPATIAYGVAALATIAAIAAPFVGGIISGGKAATAQKEEEEKEKRSEEASLAEENIEATKEEVNGINELTSAYRDLLEEYRETGKGKEDLIAKAQEISQALGDESIAALALAGDYDALTEAIRRAETAKWESERTGVISDIDTQAASYVDTFKDTEEGYVDTDGDNQLHIDLGTGQGTGDEGTYEKLIKEGIELYGEGIVDLDKDKTDKNGYAIYTLSGTKGTHEQQSIAMTRVLQYANEQYANIEEENPSDAYKDARSFLSKTQDAASGIIENKNYVLENDIKNEVRNRISGAKSQEEYNTIREELLTEFGNTDEEKAYLQAALSEYGNQNYEQVANAAEGVAGAYAKVIEEKNIVNPVGLPDISNIMSNSDSITQRAIAALAGDTAALERIAKGESKFLDEVTKKKEEAAKADARLSFNTLELTSEAADRYSTHLMNNNKLLKNNSELAGRVASATAKSYSGFKNLNKIWSTSGSVLNDLSSSGMEYANAVEQVGKGIADLFNIDYEKYGTAIGNYVENNTEDITQMMQGNQEAFKRVQQNTTKAVLNSMSKDEQGNERDISGLNNFANYVKNKNFQLGATLSEEAFIDEIAQEMDKDEYSKDEAEAILNSMGFSGVYTNGLLTSVVKTLNEEDILQQYAKDYEEVKKEHEKFIKEEIDLYYKQDQAIEQLNDELSLLSKKKSYAYGQDKLNLIQKEIDKNKELVKVLKEKQNTNEKDLQLSQKELMEMYGVKFSENGDVDNWEEIQEKALNNLNSIFKSAGGNSQNYKDAKAEYEEMKEMVGTYSEDLSNYRDIQQEIIDQQYEMIDLSYEHIEYSIEYKTEIDDDKLALLDYQLSLIEDHAFASAEKIELLGQKTNIAMNAFNRNKQGIYNTLSALTYEDGITKQFTEEEITRLLDYGDETVLDGKVLTPQLLEQIRQYREDMITNAQDIRSYASEMEEALQNELDGWVEKFEKQNALLEYHSNLISNYENIIDILGEDKFDTSFIQEIQQAKTEANRALIISAKSQMDSLTAAQAEIKKSLDTAIQNSSYDNPEEDPIVQYWQEIYDNVTEQANEAKLNVQEILASSLEDLIASFEKTVNGIIREFSQGVSGIYNNIEDLANAFERVTDTSDRYYQNFEKTYELSKLNRQIAQQLDKTDNVAAQKQLKALQSEINSYTADGVQMSKYELEYLQKKYDLMLAEQAFKEAQNVKNTVKLQRDSQGNYHYVYSASEQQVDTALQKLEDQQYQMSMWQSETEQALTEEYVNMLTTYEERMEELAEKYGVNSEEFAYYSTQLTEQFSEDISYILGEFSKFTENSGIQFKDLLLYQMYPDVQDFAQLSTKLEDKMANSVHGITDAFHNLETNTSSYLGESGYITKDIQDFSDAVSEDLASTTAQTEAIADAIVSIAAAMTEDMNKGIATLEGWHLTLQGQIPSIEKDCKRIADAIGLITASYEALYKAGGTVLELDTPPVIEGDRSQVYTNDGSYTDPKSGLVYTRVALKNEKTGKPLERRQDSELNWYYKAQDNQFYKVTDEHYDEATGKFTYKSQADMISNRWNENTKEYVSPMNTLADIMYNKFYRGSSDRLKLSMNDSKLMGSFSSTGEGQVFKINKYGFPEGWEEEIPNNAIGLDYSINVGTINDQGYIPFQISDGPAADHLHTAWVVTKNLSTNDPLYTSVDNFISVLNSSITSGRNVDQLIKDLQNTEEYKGWTKTKILNQALTQAGVNTLGFDTGGYTGSWGPEGRMAMLHQKEIVLNAHDTENLLTVVGIVRSMVDQLEVNTKLASYGLGQLTARTIGVSNDTLQQEVTIHAEFPNATDHNEIEEAFRTLTNYASQYAFRR